MLTGGWHVYVRDANLARVAQLSEFHLETVERHLGLGRWTLEADISSPNIDYLLPQANPGAGIQLVAPDGRVVFAGPVTHWQRTRDSVTTGRVVVEGWDDATALHARLIHPQPSTAAPPFSTSSHASHTGPASTVLRSFIADNVGPAAPLVARRWPNLVLADDPAEGPTVTVSGRWQNLLERLAEVAGPQGMVILARQRVDGGPQIIVEVRQARDLTGSVELSPRAGTLTSWVEEWSAPTMTAGWVGGQGELTDRTVHQDAEVPPVEWPWRVERFVDYTNSENPAELTRKFDEELAAGRATTRLELTPVEQPGAVFGVDFDLGDFVRVVIDGVELSSQVTTSATRFDAAGVSRSFTVGDPPRAASLFAQIVDLHTRVKNLEGH